MKKDYTHITFVLDRSGSMNSVWHDVTGGFVNFIAEQKKLEGKCTFSLVAFDHEVATPISFHDIKDISDPIREHNIAPRGSTAMFDGIGQAIDKTGRELAALDESERPEKVLIVIQTDGYENASREYKSTKVRELIAQQRDQYNWQFLFLGADEGALNMAVNDLGIGAGYAAKYNTRNSDGMLDVLSMKTSSIRSFQGDLKSEAYASTVMYCDAEKVSLQAEK